VTVEQLALALPEITVHCFACPHTITATTPDEAHDRMEAHYDVEHAVYIRSVTR
jgi:hypothetical protein